MSEGIEQKSVETSEKLPTVAEEAKDIMREVDVLIGHVEHDYWSWDDIKRWDTVTKLIHFLHRQGLIDSEELDDYYKENLDANRVYEEMVRNDDTTMGDIRRFMKEHLLQYRRLLEPEFAQKK